MDEFAYGKELFIRALGEAPFFNFSGVHITFCKIYMMKNKISKNWPGLFIVIGCLQAAEDGLQKRNKSPGFINTK